MISVIISSCVGSFRCQIFTCIFAYRMIVSSSGTISKGWLTRLGQIQKAKRRRYLGCGKIGKHIQLAFVIPKHARTPSFSDATISSACENKDSDHKLATLRLEFVLVGMSLFQWIDALDPQIILQHHIYEHLRVSMG